MGYNAVQSLTVNGKRYDSFPDREARETKLPQPGEGAGVGQYLAVASVDEQGRVSGIRAVDAPRTESCELPVAGAELGGVKNGGNVTVNSDGTMTAPAAQVSEEQVAAVVKQWMEENPEATTTVQDGSLTRSKLADELLAELGLDGNHHLTEVRLETMRCNWDGKENAGGSYTLVKPFRTPTYIKFSTALKPHGNISTVFSSTEDFSADLRYADGLFWRSYKAEELEPMYMEGVPGYEYCRMLFQTSAAFTVMAYYDSYEHPVSTEKTKAEIGLWTANSRMYAAAVVPFKPCSFYLADESQIAGGQSLTDIYGTNNENIFSDIVQPSLFEASSAAGHENADLSKYVHLYKVGTYREKAEGETYKTFDASGIQGRPPKYLVFPLTRTGCSLTDRDAVIEFFRQQSVYTIRGGLSDELPVRINKFIYPQIKAPQTGRHWLLLGDSITDWFAGEDYSGQGFASKIALEFDMTFENIGKEGGNLDEGISLLNSYIAGVESGNKQVPDYITIAYGTNGSGSHIGSVDDGVNANTYPGWVKKIIGIIREKFPRTVIGFVLPMQGDWVTWNPSASGKDIKGNHDAIKAVLGLPEYAVPYIDMYCESGIVPAMLPNEQYPTDTIHPRSDWAQELYYRAMRRFLMGL